MAATTLKGEEGEPDQQREEERLGHRGGREVEDIGVEGEEGRSRRRPSGGRGCAGPRRYIPATARMKNIIEGQAPARPFCHQVMLPMKGSMAR